MNTLADQRRLIDALQKAHAAQVIETHISWVLLVGEYAYKIKKSVDLGFLDYSNLSSRKHFCEEELRLNRRTAPDLYLEVVNIGGSVVAPRLGVQPAIEHAVKMRRFPEDALLDDRLSQGVVQPSHIDALAAVVADFHARASALDLHSPYGTAHTIHAAAMQNFEQLRALLKENNDLHQLDELERQTDAEWHACAEKFEARRNAGFVRECHGDLHLGNIALIDDMPVPFDGIEFSPSLRWIDVMDEVAFTMMDLLHHGRGDYAWRYLNAYLETSGDYAGVSVLRFYLAYRATVRAKVAAIRAGQEVAGSAARAALEQTCRTHLSLASRCLADRHQGMVITHGLPGSGKTTFAQYVLEQIGAVRIRSDVERKRLFGLSPLQDSKLLAVDIYSQEATTLTYGRLQELAGIITGAGHTVVVDAAFLKHQERQKFAVQTQDGAFVIATLNADVMTLRDRVRMRRMDASEADEAVLERLKSSSQALTEAEKSVAVSFDTRQGPQSKENRRNWKRLMQLLGR